jgi:hypothetical protein
MATDKPTKAKLQAAAAAAGIPLSEYIRILADKSMSGQQGEIIPVTNTVASVKRDTTSILQALALILSHFPLTSAEVRMVENSPLSFLTDRVITDVVEVVINKAAGRAASRDSSQAELSLGS